jgi:hypothetical protein
MRRVRHGFPKYSGFTAVKSSCDSKYRRRGTGIGSHPGRVSAP